MKLSDVYPEVVMRGGRGDLTLSRMSVSHIFHPVQGPRADEVQCASPAEWVKHTRLVGALLPPGVWGDEVWPHGVGRHMVAFEFSNGGVIAIRFEEIRDEPAVVAAKLLVLA